MTPDRSFRYGKVLWLHGLLEENLNPLHESRDIFIEQSMARETAVITTDMMKLDGRDSKSQARYLSDLGFSVVDGVAQVPGWLGEFQVLGRFYEVLSLGYMGFREASGEAVGLARVRRQMGGDDVMPAFLFS